jgi:hypothetical protein
MKKMMFIVLFSIALAETALAAVATPTVTGPVGSPGIPGAPAHNYIFFATNHDLAIHGYVEEEFFITGTATRFNTPAQATGTIIDSNHPYKTRIVVRRPADARRFNGTVLVEWDNVTNNFDAENMWFFAWEHMIRDGYVWVGVSAQNAGITALKKFSEDRYGTLDTTHGGTVAGDALSFDIFPRRVNPSRIPEVSTCSEG